MREEQRKLVEQRNENLRKLKKALEKYELHEEPSSKERIESENVSEERSGDIHDLNKPSEEKNELLDVVREIMDKMDKQEELL